MPSIKNISWIIAALVILVVLVLVRAFNTNLFKQNASDVLVSIESTTVSIDALQSLTGKYTIVELDDKSGLFGENSIAIPFDQILEKSNRKKFESFEGATYLFSSSTGKTAQSWVILNQLGYNNVYILCEQENPEALKYKFRPDTTIKPEL